MWWMERFSMRVKSPHVMERFSIKVKTSHVVDGALVNESKNTHMERFSIKVKDKTWTFLSVWVAASLHVFVFVPNNQINAISYIVKLKSWTSMSVVFDAREYVTASNEINTASNEINRVLLIEN